MKNKTQVHTQSTLFQSADNGHDPNGVLLVKAILQVPPNEDFVRIVLEVDPYTLDCHVDGDNFELLKKPKLRFFFDIENPE